MRIFIITLLLACTLGLAVPIPAHASFIVSTIEFIRKILQIEDMAHTDWKEVGRDLNEELDPDKIMKAINEPIPAKKSTADPRKNQNQNAATAAPKKPEPRPKVHPTQYLIISFFVFFIVVGSVLMLWMATRH